MVGFKLRSPVLIDCPTACLMSTLSRRNLNFVVLAYWNTADIVFLPQLLRQRRTHYLPAYVRRCVEVALAILAPWTAHCLVKLHRSPATYMKQLTSVMTRLWLSTDPVPGTLTITPALDPNPNTCFSPNPNPKLTLTSAKSHNPVRTPRLQKHQSLIQRSENQTELQSLHTCTHTRQIT